MPGIVGSFRDCPAIIYDSDNVCIAEAVIKEHDKIYSTVTVEASGALDSLKKGVLVNLLIIHSGGVSEYSGTVQAARFDVAEIALFNERQREARGSQRHKLNAPATVNSLVFKIGNKVLNPVVRITVENISATGALIISPPRHFGLGYVLEIHVNIHGKDAVLYASIVRVIENEDGTVSYGCKFLFWDK